jgi:hypothetical protein
VNPKKQRPPADNQGGAGDGANVKNSLPTVADIAYVVVVVSPYGQPRRHPYLSLHHATAALQRAKAKGQPARMLLCRLEPVTADLDLDSGELS